MNSKVLVSKILNLSIIYYDFDSFCLSNFDNPQKNKTRFAKLFLDILNGSQLEKSTQHFDHYFLKLESQIENHKELHSIYKLEIMRIIRGKDKRTTLMIRNIPNKFTYYQLIGLINQKFKNDYDIFVLPMDIKANKNFGYAFINFKHYFHIIRFYHEFQNSEWQGTNSNKICAISYSKIQGKNKLKKHYPQKNIYYNRNNSTESVNNSSKFYIPKIYKKYFMELYPHTLIIEEEEYFCIEFYNLDD